MDIRYKELVREWELLKKVQVIDTEPTFNQVDKIKFIFLEGDYKGYTGSTHLSNIQRLGGVTFQSLLPEEKTRWYKETLPKYGAEYISGEHKNISTPITIKITQGMYSGYYGTITKSTLLQKGTRGTKNTINFTQLFPKEKKRYFREYANSRGYTIIKYPSNLHIRGTVILKSPQGNIWNTTWYYFAYQSGNNCPLDNKISYGEACIKSILEVNSISFTYQYKIEYNGRTQYVDFYLDKNNIAIEYNGKQHYVSTGGYYTKEALEVLKDRDTNKINYCSYAGINLHIIDYKKDTLDKIISDLESLFNKKLIRPDVVTNSIDIDEKEVLNHYLNNQAKETTKKYGITIRQLGLMAKRNNFRKRDGGFM